MAIRLRKKELDFCAVLFFICADKFVSLLRGMSDMSANIQVVRLFGYKEIGTTTSELNVREVWSYITFPG